MKIVLIHIVCLTFLFSFFVCSGQHKDDTVFYAESTLPREIQKFDGENDKSQRLIYSRTGKLIYEEFYKNGLLNGTAIGYYEIGKKKSEFHYLNGLADGKQTSWYETGEIKTKGECTADSCVEKEFYLTGELKSITKLYNGRKYYYEERCLSGLVAEKYLLDGRANLYTRYRCDGSVFMTGYIIYENAFVGSFHQYYENGNIEVLGQYLDLGQNTFGTTPIGQWKFFDESGKLIEVRNYDGGGKLIDDIQY